MFIWHTDAQKQPPPSLQTYSCTDILDIVKCKVLVLSLEPNMKQILKKICRKQLSFTGCYGNQKDWKVSGLSCPLVDITLTTSKYHEKWESFMSGLTWPFATLSAFGTCEVHHDGPALNVWALCLLQHFFSNCFCLEFNICNSVQDKKLSIIGAHKWNQIHSLQYFQQFHALIYEWFKTAWLILVSQLVLVFVTLCWNRCDP